MDPYLAGAINPAATATELETLDLDLPDDVADNARVYATLAALAATTLTPHTGLVARVDAGELDPDDAAQAFQDATLAAATRDAAQPLWQELRRRLQRRHRRLITQHGDGVIDQQKGAFADAVERLRPIIETLGPGEPVPADVLDGGTQTVKAWNQRQDAVDAVDAATRVRHVLAHDGHGPRKPAASWFLSGVANMVELEQAERIFAADGIPGLIAAGYGLALNNVDESARLVADAEAATRMEAQAPVVSPEEQDRRQRLSNAWSATTVKEEANR